MGIFKSLYLYVNDSLQCMYSGVISDGDVPVLKENFKLSLSNLLMWITGASSKPAEGFPVAPHIIVQHTDPSRLPDVNTCACRLTLPANPKLINPELQLQTAFTLVKSNKFGTEAYTSICRISSNISHLLTTIMFYVIRFNYACVHVCC